MSHGERGIAGADGCGDCGEEFAEASVLSGLASGEAEPRGASALCGAVLPARGGVPRAPAGAGGADRGPAAGIDSGEPGGGRESNGAASETVAGVLGGGGGRGKVQYPPTPPAWGRGPGGERSPDFPGSARARASSS